ncbi:MAG TPA: hypothetical protein VE863_07345 [Pyrinomonadaceae bacterium]|jgi:hypothetical protein|nr:hypothetical protein [Pyrinomonadaceae bacterium]
MIKPRRFVLFILVLALGAAAPAAFGQAQKKDFYVQLIVVTGEFSRDANSVTRTLTISPDYFQYKETYQGARAGKRTPITREFKLTTQDQSELIELLRSDSLLSDSSTSKPRTKDTNRYFQLSLTSALDGKEHSVSIEGAPSSDLKTDKIYQAFINLIQRLYTIINRTEPDLTIPSLLDN